MPEHLGARIRAARLKKGMTQDDLARLTNTTKQNIYKYESEIITNIPLDRLEAIAAALSIPPADLLGWTDERPVVLSRTEQRLLAAWRAADPAAQEIALETLENHPKEKAEASAI